MGLAGRQAPGLAQTTAAPVCGSPGPRDPPAAAPLTQPPTPGSGRGTRAPAAAHVVARRTPSPGAGGAAGSCCLATGQQLPPLQIPEVGGFPELAAALSRAELHALHQGHPRPPLPLLRACVVGAAHPDCAKLCQALVAPPHSPCPLHGAGGGCGEQGEIFGVRCMCIS